MVPSGIPRFSVVIALVSIDGAFQIWCQCRMSEAVFPHARVDNQRLDGRAVETIQGWRERSPRSTAVRWHEKIGSSIWSKFMCEHENAVHGHCRCCRDCVWTRHLVVGARAFFRLHAHVPRLNLLTIVILGRSELIWLYVSSVFNRFHSTRFGQVAKRGKDYFTFIQ